MKALQERMGKREQEMDNREISYTSQTYNAAKAFICAFPIFCTCLVLVIFFGRHIDSEGFVIAGWIGLCTIPFLFQRRFKQLFTRKIFVEFDSQVFLVKEFALKKEILVKELTLQWSNIKSYKFNFSATGTTYLVIYLRDGSSMKFSFKGEMNQLQSINERSIFSIFYYFIKQYNLDKEPGEEIYFEPAFLTTKAGEIVIYILIILAILAIVIHIILRPGTSMFSFMSIFIILGLVAKRHADKKLFEKINKLEARQPF